MSLIEIDVDVRGRVHGCFEVVCTGLSRLPPTPKWRSTMWCPAERLSMFEGSWTWCLRLTARTCGLENGGGGISELWDGRRGPLLSARNSKTRAVPRPMCWDYTGWARCWGSRRWTHPVIPLAVEVMSSEVLRF